MTEQERFTHKKWYGEHQILDYNKGFAVIDTYTQAKIICKKLNELHEENEELKERVKQLQLNNKVIKKIYKTFYKPRVIK